jgi:hypothetical protein
MSEPTIRIFGRPPLQQEQRRSEVVTTRLRPSEYDAAITRAKAAGFPSVAEYSRSLLTGTPVVDTK